MSDVWELPGQAHAAEVLRAAAASREVGHAWAFIGPPGVGQQQAAHALAAALNCQVDPAGCGECDICQRCLRGAFPAQWVFAPTGAMHRVIDVRDTWLPAATHTAIEGEWKVLRIVDADRMNEAAANAFLKALEEPPPNTVWLLDIADPDELPDTILSRCRALRFAPWSLTDLVAQAAALGIDAHEQQLAARLAQGSPRALERLADGGLDDVRLHRSLYRRLRDEGQGVALLAAREVDDEIKRRTAARKDAGKVELSELEALYGDALPRGVAKQVEERLTREEREAKSAAVQGALDDLLTWTRDVLLLASGGNELHVRHIDAIDELRADAEALNPATLLYAAERIMAVKEDFERNLQQNLALEALYLELATVQMAGGPPAPTHQARLAGALRR